LRSDGDRPALFDVRALGSVLGWSGESGERLRRVARGLGSLREPDEFAAGHPAGAVNVPLASLPEALSRLPEAPIAFTCRSGARSLRAAQAAHAAGRSDVSNVTGGYIAWEKAGLPIETSTRAEA